MCVIIVFIRYNLTSIWQVSISAIQIALVVCFVQYHFQTLQQQWCSYIFCIWRVFTNLKNKALICFMPILFQCICPDLSVPPFQSSAKSGEISVGIIPNNIVIIYIFQYFFAIFFSYVYLRILEEILLMNNPNILVLTPKLK